MIGAALGSDDRRATVEELWSLQPFASASAASHETTANPIDQILEEEHRRLGLAPLPAADRATLVRRLRFNLTGLPPTIEEQKAFVTDPSGSAYENLVDRLLADPQHGVRYSRHWLDVLRYTDVDESMPAGSSIHFWRDWVIRALNRNLPYDAFVRTQISGMEFSNRTRINALGIRSRRLPRPDNVFALGFLARGATSRSNRDHALSISATETISTAFLGMTVHCAKCHDHFFDPITQVDYYRMKAIFDPLRPQNLQLATASQIIDYGEALRTYETGKANADAAVAALEDSYRTQLYNERVSMLPPEIQRIIRKSESERSTREQKIADDYFPVLRIDVGKIREVMPEEIRSEYDALRKEQSRWSRPTSLPTFLTVEEDPALKQEVRHVLNSGDPNRPEKDRVVQPGLLFSPGIPDFSEGLRETLVDWMTAPDNPLFARVAVNRIWQWHFGSGLHRKANDFGSLVEVPELKRLLDTLAAEFVAHDFDMKWLHKTIVMSNAYRRASLTPTDSSNEARDPSNHYYWRFPLRRLEAEPIYDALLTLAGRLDLRIGGPSYVATENLEGRLRRGIYLKRGFRSQEELLPEFLDAFDAQDGRESCARREETVTAPQAMWLMNNPLVEAVTLQLGERLRSESDQDPLRAIQLGYQLALSRKPKPHEIQLAMNDMQAQSQPFQTLAWLLVNLDEFIYVR